MRGTHLELERKTVDNLSGFWIKRSVRRADDHEPHLQPHTIPIACARLHFLVHHSWDRGSRNDRLVTRWWIDFFQGDGKRRRRRKYQ